MTSDEVKKAKRRMSKRGVIAEVIGRQVTLLLDDEDDLSGLATASKEANQYSRLNSTWLEHGTL